MTPAELLSAVRAALDETERVTRAAVVSFADAGEWTVKREGAHPPAVMASPTAIVADRLGTQDATHIARHDPAAVLRRVAADRQILAAHDREHYCPLPVVVGINGQLWTAADGPCYTLRLLADGLGIDLEETPQ